jgi:hypothetical protein
MTTCDDKFRKEEELSIPSTEMQEGEMEAVGEVREKAE